GEPDGEQLARVVPLVVRLAGVDALVALQPEQRGAEGARQRLGRLRLADAGFPFEQQRLGQLAGEEQRGRQDAVREVTGAVEPGQQLLDAHRRANDAGSATNASRHPVPQNHQVAPPTSADSDAGAHATVMPQTGSVAVGALAGASPDGPAAGRRGRALTISARIDTATSPGVRAPMSNPAGVCTRPASMPTASSTPAPRRGDATRDRKS